MAGFARIRCWEMRLILAGGLLSIVAAETSRCDALMIEDRISPLRSDMAGLAIIAGGNVIEGFAARALPVMAGDAGASRLRVIEFFDLPRAGSMTSGALIAGRNMIVWFASGNIAVVAGETAGQERCVIDMHL